MYTFHIETRDGSRVEWHGLTLTQAKRMYALTEQCIPDNVTRFGWGREA